MHKPFTPCTIIEVLRFEEIDLYFEKDKGTSHVFAWEEGMIGWKIDDFHLQLGQTYEERCIEWLENRFRGE